MSKLSTVQFLTDVFCIPTSTPPEHPTRRLKLIALAVVAALHVWFREVASWPGLPDQQGPVCPLNSSRFAPLRFPTYPAARAHIDGNSGVTNCLGAALTMTEREGVPPWIWSKETSGVTTLLSYYGWIPTDAPSSSTIRVLELHPGRAKHAEWRVGSHTFSKQPYQPSEWIERSREEPGAIYFTRMPPPTASVNIFAAVSAGHLYAARLAARAVSPSSQTAEELHRLGCALLSEEFSRGEVMLWMAQRLGLISYSPT